MPSLTLRVAKPALNPVNLKIPLLRMTLLGLLAAGFDILALRVSGALRKFIETATFPTISRNTLMRRSYWKLVY
jgi:hypothetical protein